MGSGGHGEGRRDSERGADVALHVASVATKAAPARPGALVRDRAVEVDRSRRSKRRNQRREALEIWQALVEGRWALFDWFDTDDRRYILAIPSRPSRRNPKALTKRESEVAVYAALGESHKHIGYRLGIARSTVTNTLRSAMRKLGVSTQAQLVRSLHGMELPSENIPAHGG